MHTEMKQFVLLVSDGTVEDTWLKTWDSLPVESQLFLGSAYVELTLDTWWPAIRRLVVIGESASRTGDPAQIPISDSPLKHINVVQHRYWLI